MTCKLMQVVYSENYQKQSQIQHLKNQVHKILSPVRLPISPLSPGTCERLLPNTIVSNNLTTTAKPAYIQCNFTFAKTDEMINTVDKNVSKESYFFMKRYREPKAKPGELKAQWGKLKHDTPDLCFAWGEGVPKCDARMLSNTLNLKQYRPGSFDQDPSFLEELEARGYDITTLKFSIQKKTS